MADLIIEAKRRNLSGLNFSSFGQNLSRQKLSSQGSGVGRRESSVAFMQAKQKLLTKQKVKQRQRKAAVAAAKATVSLVELAIDLTSVLLVVAVFGKLFA